MTSLSLSRWRGLWVALSALALVLALARPAPVRAQVTTGQIVSQTIAAMPSCLRYEVRGICFFLKCTLFACSIVTSIRVRHYVPDVIVSSYHDPATHPWVEIGKPLAAAMSGAGSLMMGMPVDSSASTAREHREVSTFKSADAIGNPAGMIAAVIAGSGFSNVPTNFTVPGATELMKFPTQELPAIQQQWASVPTQLGNNLLADAANLAKAPGALLGNMQSAIGKVGSVLNSGVSLGDMSSITSQLSGVDLGPLQKLVQGLQGSSSESVPFCPGSASMFSLHFQSDLDSPFWRGLIPLEMLYPASWIPGLQEVSHSPTINTWGGRYPRTGQVVQSHPVKSSAVYAERVGSIITKSAQPHIYTRLTPGGGVVYFETFGATRWQMLSPLSPGNGSCIQFGQNDALSLFSYGDYKTSSTDGYVWNMWNRYDCCQRRTPIFLFSIP